MLFQEDEYQAERGKFLRNAGRSDRAQAQA